jgi:multicomponent Na+:H+ antiporter subunit D
MIEILPLGSILILGALLTPVLPSALRNPWLVLLPVLGMIQLWSLPLGFELHVEFFDYTLELTRIDRLSRVFGTVFHIAAFLSAIYAYRESDRDQQVAASVYAGSAIAGVFAGDLLSLFVMWELTAISSVFLIWGGSGQNAFSAGIRYVVIQVGSGVLLLAGTIVHYNATGSLDFGHLGLETAGGPLILFAFGIKAAFPLLHNWLQDAYPEARATGAVYLSGFTTKLAIYALARGFAGTEILIPIGALMTAFPIFYAVIENDLRRVLAYSLNNQLGFMVVGIGIGTELALNGTAAHAFAHIIYKALLFMSMGAVLTRVGHVRGSDLGGLYRTMPKTAVLCMVGAASISAFPLTSGFVSKSMILEAAAQEHHMIVFLVLLFASAGVFHHSGIKIPYFAFFGHDSGQRPPEAPRHMLIAMIGAAALCIGIGVWPAPLYALLPYPVDYVPYTASHVGETLQLLMFSALAFGFLMRTGLYPPELWAINLDSDWLYRRPLKRAVQWFYRICVRARAAFDVRASRALGALIQTIGQPHRPGGMLGEPWPTGPTVLWAALLLGIYLLLYYGS